MKPLQRRAELPEDSYWIVGINRRGRLVVILDVTVPAGSVAEKYLTRAALRDWREHRRNVLLFTPAAALGVMLLLGAAGVLVWVLVGAPSTLPGPVERPDAARPAVPHPAVGARSRPAGSPGSALARPSGMSRVSTAATPSSAPASVEPVDRTSASSPTVTVSVPRSHPVRSVRSPLPVKVRPGHVPRPCELLGLPVGHCRR